MRRVEMARRRKNLSEKRNEEEKVAPNHPLPFFSATTFPPPLPLPPPPPPFPPNPNSLGTSPPQYQPPKLPPLTPQHLTDSHAPYRWTPSTAS